MRNNQYKCNFHQIHWLSKLNLIIMMINLFLFKMKMAMIQLKKLCNNNNNFKCYNNQIKNLNFHKLNNNLYQIKNIN